MRSTAGLEGPVYLRISESAQAVYGSVPEFGYGQWPRLRSGSGITLLGYGMGAGLAVTAAAELASRGVEADVYDAAYLKPFDEAALVETARRTGKVLTIEEHSEVGGLAAIAAEVAGRHKLSVDLRHIALPDKDLEAGVLADLYEYYGLTAENVVGTALELARA